MNTKKIKEIGKWMMVAGGTIFTSGAGFYFVGNYIERKDEKHIHQVKMDRINEEERIKSLKLREEKIKAETEKDRAYAEQLKNMDQKTFAKLHADRVSVANENVIKDAERVKKETEAEMVRVRLECNEQINKIREECLRKVEAADKKRDDAVKKYEVIDTLFTNKDKILRAKEALDAAVQKDKKAKDDKEELLENIKEMLS
jgi:hypothetical protein